MMTKTNGGAPMEASSAGRAAELAHERTAHEGAQLHHHHTHAATSSHGGGHHLLQVEDLSVSFRMYNEDAPYFKAKQHDVQVLHELSIAVHARVIVADEPTPGLDLDLAVRALDDFRAFANEGNGVLLITHDIELALRVADRVAVFKDGTVVEETATASFADPSLLRHPFTRQLWHALPEHDFAVGESAGGKVPAHESGKEGDAC